MALALASLPRCGSEDGYLLSGVVRDAAGPLGYAGVYVDPDHLATTAVDGRFEISFGADETTRTVQILIGHRGYRSEQRSVYIESADQTLEPVELSEDSGVGFAVLAKWFDPGREGCGQSRCYCAETARAGFLFNCRPDEATVSYSGWCIGPDGSHAPSTQFVGNAVRAACGSTASSSSGSECESLERGCITAATSRAGEPLGAEECL